MTFVKTIIAGYKTQLQTFGFLSPIVTAKQSDRVRQMRPSLRKVTAALQENPDLFKRNVQDSPLSVLFNFTLPKIEHILHEVGEERAEQMVGALVEHGMKMIGEHGLEGAREHLEEMCRDLMEYEGRLREDGSLDSARDKGVEGIIEAYRKLDFEGRGEAYLRLKLGNKIGRLEESNQSGKLFLSMDESTEDSDLICLHKIKNLTSLFLEANQITDDGLKHINKIASLQWLYLKGTRITNNGLKHLKDMPNLDSLILWRTQITDAGLLVIGEMKKLKVLDLQETQITNAGLEHLRGLGNLRELYLKKTEIDDLGLKHLQGFKHLERLDLANTQVTIGGANYLRELLPGVLIRR